MRSITEDTLEEILAQAASAPRKRINLNLHATPDDPVNRFLNAGIAGTYIQPHRHAQEKWELVNILLGSVDAVVFDSSGRIMSRIRLCSGGPRLVEIPGGEWHTFVFVEPRAVVLEIKPGPYQPATDKEFATWAPAENDAKTTVFLSWANNARIGDVWTDPATP